MAEDPKKPPEPPRPASISEQTDVPASVPMTPIGSDEDLGVFTPASLQRLVSQSGGGIVLAPGDSGPAVEQLQYELRVLGLLPDELQEPEGTYGEDTESAVRVFQDANGFVQTGRVDNRMRGLLRAAAKDRGA